MKHGLILIVIMVLCMYIGTTMFYNTGVGITDFNFTQADSDDNQYDLSFILRSVRSFDYLDCEYMLISDDGQQIATSSTILTNITDGSFPINETLKSNDSSKVPKKLQIRIYTEKFNPELKNSDGSPSQEVFFEQTMDV